MENQIQSFATFSETRKAAMETKLREEASAKRTTEAQRFADLLAEYEVTTVAEIAEEQRTEFFAKLVGETDKVETEGNAFGDAVRKAKEAGEDEFTVGGETYKVKESNESVNEEVSKTYKIPTQKGTLHIEVEEDAAGAIVDVIFNRVDLSTTNIQYSTGDVEITQRKKKVKLKESVEEAKVEEADVKSAEDFKEYAFAVLKKAFGDDFDEAKAQEVVDGLTDKHGEDYGAMVGALQSSLG